MSSILPPRYLPSFSSLIQCRLRVGIHTFQIFYCCCCRCCCCCCSHINSRNQVRGHRTGSSHSGAEEYPREKHKQTKGGTRIYHSWRNSCLHQKHIKVKSGVSLRCARSILVHTSHYLRLEKPTIPLATQERLPRIYYT